MSNVIAFPSRRVSAALASAKPIRPESRTSVTATDGGRGGVGWTWSALSSFLPAGLPAGALILIRIRAFEPGVSEQVVGDLIRSTTTTGKACVYVPVNGSPHYPRVTDGSAAHVVVDQDVAASVVEPATQTRHWYECGVPSLTVLAPPVSRIEQREGPALVILDGFQGARPYNQSGQGDETVAFGDFVALDRHGLNKWRAADVLAYAQTRPQAPTVVVWHTGLHDEDHGGYSALVDVAHVVVECCELIDGPRMLISSRSSLEEPLPFQAPVW